MLSDEAVASDNDATLAELSDELYDSEKMYYNIARIQTVWFPLSSVDHVIGCEITIAQVCSEWLRPLSHWSQKFRRYWQSLDCLPC
jgi:hypothetical protein